MTDERQDRPESGDADRGAFLGSGREWAADSIRDGPQPGDERIAGEATQSTGVGALDTRDQGGDEEPAGHRHGPRADDDAVRQAGENV